MNARHSYALHVISRKKINQSRLPRKPQRKNRTPLPDARVMRHATITGKALWMKMHATKVIKMDMIM